MHELLTDIELDIQELKCLIDAFAREPNAALRGVLKRNVMQMRTRLDILLLQLDDIQSAKVESVSPVIEPIVKPLPLVESPLVVEPSLVPTPILGDRIKTAVDLRRSISLNDSFRFSRELFGGDGEQMNRILQQIGEMSSYTAALSVLTSKVKVNEDNEAMADLLELLKKYFN